MRTPPQPSRLVAVLAAGSLVLAQVAPGRADTATATAEATATPDGASQASASQAAADLPSRVGRLARLSGTVSFHTADEDHWDPATLNYPVTSGDAFWTEPQATASIEVAGSHVDMASSTEFDVDQLDDRTLTATQAQGETFLDVRDMQPGETLTVRTPRGSVAIGTDGQYEIAAGDTQAPTTVTVVTGAAQISGDNLSLSVAAGQGATITGSGASGDAFQGSVAAANQRDDFLVGELAAATAGRLRAETTVTAQAPQPRPRVEARATARVTVEAPAVVRQMSGGQDLTSYGDWQDTEQYGHVWYPRVQQDWVPYRDGHWAYVAPWGWTWIDEAAWGFAPFHYGRWVQVADRWGWAPVYAAPGFVLPAFYRPVYAPALVGFFGFGAGLAAGLAIGGRVGFGFGLGYGGFGYGHIGWCPLGWGEPFRPWFGGAGYFDRVNRFDVANIRNVTYNNSVHNVTINNFANAERGATVVPTEAMLRSQRAAGLAEPFSRAQFGQTHPVSTTPRPIAGTAGLTGREAARLGVPAAAATAAAHASPGPHVGGDAHGSVALRSPASRMAAWHQAGESGHGAAAVHSGLPPLRGAGSFARASGGAPGPAFTPRAGLQAGRVAPGPTLAHAGGSIGGRAVAGGTLPVLRSHMAASVPDAGGRTGAFSAAHFPAQQRDAGARPQFGASRPDLQQHATPSLTPSLRTMPMQRSQSAQRAQPAQHAVPEVSRAATPRYETPRAQASQARLDAPRYQAPQQRFQAPQSRSEAPRYQVPQQQFQAPRYQAPQQQFQAPRYQAPQQQFQTPRYQAPQQQFQAPRQQANPRSFAAPGPRPAPGAKRPWPP